MSILAAYYCLLAIAVAGAIGSLILGRRAKALIWPAAVLICFALGALWQEIALRTFAGREVDGMSGLILRPVPNSGGDHEFTTHGAHYAKFSFVVPAIAALVAALVVVVTGVAVRRSVEVAAAVCTAFLTGALLYVLLALARLLAASDIFI